MASLDIICILRRELPQFGCPASTVSALAEISSGKLSAYLNGAVQCPAQDQLALRRTWTQLKKLVEYADCLPIDFRKVLKLRQALDALQAGHLQIVVISNHDRQEINQ